MNDIEYKILSFDRTTGSALVKFWKTNSSTSLTYSIDIPFDGNKYLEGDKLHEWVLTFTPVSQLERIANAENKDSSFIEALIAKDEKYEVPVKKENNPSNRFLTEITNRLNEKIQGGFSFEGDSYMSDGEFRAQLRDFISLHTFDILPSEAKLTVRKLNNEFEEIDIAKAKRLALAAYQYVTAIYTEYWQAKDSIPG